MEGSISFLVSAKTKINAKNVAERNRGHSTGMSFKIGLSSNMSKDLPRQKRPMAPVKNAKITVAPLSSRSRMNSPRAVRCLFKSIFFD